MNYLYNGVELPALPEWDTETYPYAWLKETYTSIPKRLRCFLTAMKRIEYKYENGGIYLKRDAVRYYIGDSKEWELLEQSGESEWLSVDGANDNKPAFWSNFTIYNEDGSVYLAASDPIPVNPPNPTAMLMGYMVGQAT